MALQNTRSLNNKGHILADFITDNNLDFLYLTETWHNHLDLFPLNQATPPPPGYSYLHQPRLTGRGGGVAVIHKQTLKTAPAPTLSVHSFENISVKLPGPTPLVIVTIYRPPKPHPSFLSDFFEFVTHLNTISSSVLLLGDFNFHIDNPTCKQASDFLDLLDTLNLTQHVHSPTHSHGHTLDLVCSTGISIHHLSTTNLYISDHLAVTFNVDPPPPPTSQ
ncbi:LOW QUALITY PROTEIN: uncharacterized protein LOC127597372%2C partial [Xyrichtys novacula]|uniref:LOW QUALITY PROTEIN: uncharacterized protein LOC127597372, partial n=1 Tax=Xyrichtys novacula TaxID=13765 RepID=A0AAV1EQ09_XYRNO|nr:LOW QUALITY PROTEIN: uncharacterized protein LOC127597372%2C partial [Xyrichtys novacula]